MVGCALERDVGSQDTMHRLGKGLAVREPHSDVIEPGRPRWSRRSPLRLSGVEPDVVVVAARGDERGLVTHWRLLLETEDVPPEGECAIEIGHLQVDVPDVDARVEQRW